MHLTLHVGAHKTASTTFQHVLRAEREQFEQHGIAVVAKSYLKDEVDLYRQGPRRALAADASLDSLSHFGKAYAAFLDATEQDTVILSDEDILGRILRPGFGFYEHGTEKMRALMDHVQPTSVSVILYVRNQTNYLESCYKELFNMGAPMLFERYLAGIDVQGLSWLTLAEGIHSVVGDGNLIVRPYEVIRSVGANQEFSDIVRLSTPGAEGIQLTKESVSNVSLGAGDRLKLWKRKQKFGPKRLRIIAKRLRDKAKPEDSDRLLPQLFRDALMQEYSEQNAELFRRFLPGFDPKTLGFTNT